MRSSVAFSLKIVLFLIFGTGIMGCKKECGPVRDPFLTAKEKEFVANQIGDSLHFKDMAGKSYYLVCTNKVFEQDGYNYNGPKDPCAIRDVKWDRLKANFEGNILNDQNQTVSAQIQIEGDRNPNSSTTTNNCQMDYKCTFSVRFFSSSQPDLQQIYEGKTNEDLFPVIRNYGFAPQITLDGQQFQKINKNWLANFCSTTKSSTRVGIDSIYYSSQYGLVRLTTVGGKKYQRVL